MSSPTPSAAPADDGAAVQLGWPLVERRRYRADAQKVPTGGERRADHPGVVAAPTARLYRWVALLWSTVLVILVDDTWWVVRAVGLAVFAAATIYRDRRPVDYNAGARTVAEVLAELGVAAALCAVTSEFGSPFVPWLIVAALQAGFAKGSRWAAESAALVAVTLSVVEFADGQFTRDGIAFGLSWLVVTVGAALVAGQTRRLGRESARQQSLALTRLEQLAEANQLLVSLHRVAQALPASLDLNDVLDSTMVRLSDLFDFDSAVVFLWDESEHQWLPARRHGAPQGPLQTSALPPPLRRVTQSAGAIRESDLVSSGHGLDPAAVTGLYAPLRARGQLIGLIALESATLGAFDDRRVGLLNGLVEPLALTIENARFFARLRTISADEERTRIARDLHDRIGQSLAYLGFEIDRATRAATRGDDVAERLERLATEVRGVTREVRETLYDLRADVSDRQDLAATMDAFCDRVRDRSGLEIELVIDASGRLPLPQEREMWRIAKEAVINAEKHAQANRLTVRWWTDGRAARLSVADNGVGLDRTTARSDSYGMLGMRERAGSIGAHLDFESAAAAGTTVRVALDPRPRPVQEPREE